MLHADIAIVGGGLAGSTAAAMLTRAGIDTILIDPRAVYPPDFRCEKLDASQVQLLRRTGFAEPVLAAGSLNRDVWIVRRGRLVEQRRNHQYGILYDSLVNAIRGQIPESARFIQAKAAAITTSADRQTIALSNGEEVSARLVVLANGLNNALRQSLGMTSEELSPCHSISIGFDVQPVGRSSFDFRALTWYPESPARRMAYLTIFRVPTGMRANFFVYGDMRNPWLSRMRDAPYECLAELPGLVAGLGDFLVAGRVHIRPVDLTVTRGALQPGLVLVGDAYATSCPAAGTGANKVFTDVERLCTVHIPEWLKSRGMGVEKIACFYEDAVKQACDAHSLSKAQYLRALSTDGGPTWKARRFGRFAGQLGAAALRRGRARLAAALGRFGTLEAG